MVSLVDENLYLKVWTTEQGVSTLDTAWKL